MKQFFLLLSLSAAAAVNLNGQELYCDTGIIRNEFQALTNQMYDLLYAGDHHSAIEEALEIIEFYERAVSVPADMLDTYILPTAWYNLACAYSLSGNIDRGIDALERAQDYGYRYPDHVRTDTDVDNLRSNPRYGMILEKMEKEWDHRTVLRAADVYTDETVAHMPVFAYEDKNNHPLALTREYFLLDTVAAGASETERIVAMMNFVNKLVPHDGGNMPPCELTAIGIYNYSQVTGRGVNCRALAIMLNECYLASGLLSSYVTCLPADPFDNDCHVITSVYSRPLGKFLWMDPSFNIYVTDGDGNMLGIEEVRCAMIEGRPLEISPGSSHNGQGQEKEWYLDQYMAKNLYWLARPVESFFNPESRRYLNNCVQVALIPPHFDSPMLESYLPTSDPEYFWNRKYPYDQPGYVAAK